MPPTYDGGCDLVAWKEFGDGQFLVRLAYTSIAFNTTLVRISFFALIWRWKGPKRMKGLLWKMGKDCLMRNKMRFAMRITEDSGCPMCHLHEESIIHARRDYSVEAKLHDESTMIQN